MTAASWPAELRALVEAMAGRPLEAVSWRELCRIRDQVDRALSAEVNRQQAPAPTGGDAA